MKKTNAELAAEQIGKHGVDRYPTPFTQFIKLVEEVGELGKEVNRSLVGPLNHKLAAKRMENLRGEMADVALALYNLAAKFSIDLDLAIEMKVTLDTRKFNEEKG